MSKNLPKQPTKLSIEDDKDLLRFEFETLLEEYRVTNAQILNRLDADDKGIEIGLTAIGALIGIAATIIRPELNVILLVLTIPFHALLWAQIRRVQTGRRLVEYVTKIIAPRLDEIIQNTSPSSDRYGKPIRFTSWEGFFGHHLEDNFSAYLTILFSQSGRALVYFITTIILPVAYIFSGKTVADCCNSPLAISLLSINVVLMALSIIMLIVTFVSAREHLQEKQ